MGLKIYPRSLDWWATFGVFVALSMGLYGASDGFGVVRLLCVLRLWESLVSRGFRAFATQVRAVILGLFVLAMYDPTPIFHWVLFVAVVIAVFFDWCVVSRTLVRMPWNKGVTLS